MKTLSQILKDIPRIPHTRMLAVMPEQPPARVMTGVSDGIEPVRDMVWPVKTRYYVNGLVDGETRVLSLSKEFWEELKIIMERDRLIESQQLAARRFKLSKMRYCR